jgi:ATP-dependent RNA helicase DDX54/DBP10
MCFSLSVKRRFEDEAREGGLEVGGDTEAALRRGQDRNKKRKGRDDRPPVKKVRSESGAWIPATYKSGRYATWLNKTKKAQVVGKFS